MSFFEADSISAGYGKNPVIRDVSFCLESGNITGILGANGSGKTTLLKAVCGILPHHGSCRLDGNILENLTPKKIARLIGYIPQKSGISIDISVLDAVLMGFNPYLKLLGQPDPAMKEKALEAIHMAGLSGLENTNYLSLSEGQKQLCIIARTIAAPHKLLLLDEPENALDFQFRHRLFQILQAFSTNERGVILTLHDPALALNCCDRLILISGGSVSGILSPKQDSIEKMETALTKLYGNVSLHRLTAKSGETQLVMIKERENI